MTLMVCSIAFQYLETAVPSLSDHGCFSMYPTILAGAPICVSSSGRCFARLPNSQLSAVAGDEQIT